jgi:hypothetical protein
MKLALDFISACEKFGITPTQLILIINIAEQTASLFEQNKFVKKFPAPRHVSASGIDRNV